MSHMTLIKRNNLRRGSVLLYSKCSIHHLSRLLCIVSTLALLQVLLFIYQNSTDRPTTQRLIYRPPFLLADVSRHGRSKNEADRSFRTSSSSADRVSSELRSSRFNVRPRPWSTPSLGCDSSNDLTDSLALCFINCSSNSSIRSFINNCRKYYSSVTSFIKSFVDCNSSKSVMSHKADKLEKCVERSNVYSQRIVYRSKRGVPCVMDGTGRISRGRCHCKKGWSGVSCNIPSVVTNSNYPVKYGLRIRDDPALILYAFPFSHEFDLLEARLKEYGDVVNVYVIVESNYTASGLQKPRLLRNRLERTDYLLKYRSKIVLTELDRYPREAYTNGWIADELLRTFIVSGGLSQLRGIRDDDIFVLTDADEIPSRSSLLFLKVNYGYPEPIGFRLRHNVFSSRWISPHNPVSNVFGACSFGTLRYVFNSNPYYLRRAPRHLACNTEEVEMYRHGRGGRVAEWSLGSDVGELQAGRHCSWCFDAEGILTKMKSAHVSDRPRWGDVEEYNRVEYISYLVEHGMWFDNITKLIISANSSSSSSSST